MKYVFPPCQWKKSKSLTFPLLAQESTSTDMDCSTENDMEQTSDESSEDDTTTTTTAAVVDATPAVAMTTTVTATETVYVYARARLFSLMENPR